MRENNAIRALGKTVLYRIALFVLVYLSLVALGLILLYIGYEWATFWGIDMLQRAFDGTNSGFVMLILLGAYLGVIALCLMFGLFLVKFIFTQLNVEEEGRIQVKESDCPQLFELIRHVARATKCPMPHKVFLSTEINACVYFNTTFWSMFFPVRKNLVLGVGLFATTSTEEIKGILAHEFGHFSQDSMKISSVVYTANIVMGNLVYGEDAWD
ncbi:MAG: M48 family metallopeptidase, partial [Prevotella sp.]